MPFSIKEMDQSGWVCYQLPNESYYYGQVGYLDESGVVNSKDNAEAANNPSNRLVKHGFGVYLYKVNQETAEPSSSYEGYWDKDQKNGEGKLTLESGAVYEGSFLAGSYHGYGRMTWGNSDCYEGSWKRNKMDGAGTFKHHSGFTLKGSFKSNYYLDEGGVLRNPQMSQQEYLEFRKERREILKQKEKQEKTKHGFVEKVSSSPFEKVKESFQRSCKNNRVPLVCSSKSSGVNLSHLVDLLQQQYSFSVSILDLRKFYTLQGAEKEEYRASIRSSFRDSLAKGQIFIVSLDESEVEFKEMFYPDIKELYQPDGFNLFSWSRDQLEREEVRRHVVGDAPIHENYRLLVWTKVKFSEECSEEHLHEKLKSRLEKLIPFVKMDCVFLQSANDLEPKDSQQQETAE